MTAVTDADPRPITARRSATKNTIMPAVMRMCPSPAMPAIILLDSCPSTVRLPCQISIAEVRITPALYSQKNHANSFGLREIWKTFSMTSTISSTMKPRVSRCV